MESVGAITVVAFLAWQVFHNWSGFLNHAQDLIPWVAVVALTDLLPVPIWGPVELMMSFPVLLASAFVFPPFIAGVLSFGATVDRRELFREISPLRALFNRSNVAASVLAASWVFHGSNVGLADWPFVLLIAAVALMADMAVNFSLVIAGTHLLTRESPMVVIRHLYGESHPEVFLAGYACFGLLAVLLSTVYAAAGGFGLIAFAVPLFLARQMFTHWKMLGEAHAQIEQKERVLVDVSSRIADERRDERLALAAGIHDEILPPLYKIHLMGQVVKNDFASGRLLDLEIDVPDLVHAVETADSALREMVRDLRQSTIGRGGLCETIELLVRDLESSATARIATELRPVKGSALTHLLAYHLAREAIHNAIRHSGASNIEVSLMEEAGHLRIVVSDDGKGFDPAGVDTTRHFGLQLMRERAELAGGVLVVDSMPGRGTTIVARLPVDDKDANQAPDPGPG